MTQYRVKSPVLGHDQYQEEIDMTETVGIIGAGVAGRAVARFFLTAGRNVVISNSRGPDSLGEVIAELGAGAAAGTTAQAAQATS